MAGQIPFFSLSQMQAEIDLEGAVGRVLAGQQYVLGPEVARFERRFADYCGVDDCIGVANGTDAIELALRALDVESGDRVAIVANAASYSSSAVRSIGAVPLWVDVDRSYLTMEPTRLKAALANGAAAVIVTHLYGQLAAMDELVSVARRAGVPVVEDCAQSHGAQRGGTRAGAFGDLGCFSFYPTKNLGAIGDGGAIITRDATLAHRVASLRQYGWAGKYRVALSGGRNSRLDELQAAVLSEKLPRLEDWNAQRREIARRYSDGLSGLPLRLPPSTDEDYVAHLYVIRAQDREGLLRHLEEAGIGIAVHYAEADHRQPISPTSSVPRLPSTEEACESVLSLPCYPGLAESQQDIIIDTVHAFHAAGEA